MEIYGQGANGRRDDSISGYFFKPSAAPSSFTAAHVSVYAAQKRVSQGDVKDLATHVVSMGKHLGRSVAVDSWKRRASSIRNDTNAKVWCVFVDDGKKVKLGMGALKEIIEK